MEVRPAVLELVTQIIESGQPAAEARRHWQRAPHAIELDELYSLALLGLAQAADRWEDYCREHGYDPAAVQYFGAYVTRRMRGAILDAMRAADWMTRSQRQRAKALRDAGADRGLSEDDLAAATGLPVEAVRATLASAAQRPVSFDAEPAEVSDPTDVESDAVVGGVMSAVASVYVSLDLEAQVVLALVYHQERTMAQAAEAIGRTENEAERIHARAVAQVHHAMLRSVA